MQGPLTEFDFKYTQFVDKLVNIFGDSGTGKSYIIKAILSLLKPHIGQIFVIAPTDVTNHTYDQDNLVPIPCIKYSVDGVWLHKFWDRQCAFAAVYHRVNQEDVVDSLFKRIKERSKDERAIERIQDHLAATVKSEDKGSAKAKKLRGACNDMIHLIKKNALERDRKALEAARLSREEKFTMKHLWFNPRALLIWDDATDIIHKLRTHDVMKKLFFQGRHSFITTILALHTDKALDTEQRDGAFVTIFTGESSARALYGKKFKSVGADKETVARVYSSIKEAFSVQHQKLVYVRETGKFHKFTAPEAEHVEFGADIVRAYCKSIKSDNANVDANNTYMRDFGM